MLAKSRREHSRYQKRVTYLEHQRNIGLLRAYDWASEFCKNRDVVEIGCGDASGAAYIVSTTNCRTYIGIDYNQLAINDAKRKKCFNKVSSIKLVRGNGENIPLKNNICDLVILFQVIEHVTNYQELLSEIVRILRPKGVLLLTTPDLEWRKTLNWKNPDHSKEFSYQELKDILAEYFEEVEIFYHYGADDNFLEKLQLACVDVPDNYKIAVKVGDRITSISRENGLIRWMVSDGYKGKIFKYLPFCLVDRIFYKYTGYPFHWLNFSHLSLIEGYVRPCLSFYCLCRKPLSI